MNIVRIFQNLVESYQAETKCGFCWEFTHARKDYSNLKRYEDGNKCCIHFILEDFECKIINTYDKETGFSEPTYEDNTFTVMVGSMARLDTIIFNEAPEDENTTQFVKHVEPLLTCLKDIQPQLCDSHSVVMNMSFKPKYNYHDANLSGVIIRGAIRTHLDT